jgi:hypothetical protein
VALKLTWDDLLIQNVEDDVLQRTLRPWSFALQGECGLVFLNRFGSWFLRRRDGSVDLLDVFDGSVRQVCAPDERFEQHVNTLAWQERYLLSLTVFDLHAAGKVARGTQCYAIAPHPALGGPNPSLGQALKPEFTLVVDLEVWQSLCRQSLRSPE